MRRKLGLAAAMIAVLGFGSLAMAKTPKINPGQTSSPTAAAAMKDNTATAAKTRTAHRRRGRKHRHTAARHTAANMKPSTKTAAPRKG